MLVPITLRRIINLFKLALPFVFTIASICQLAVGQSQRESPRGERDPRWVTPAMGYSIQQPVTQNAPASQPVTQSSGQRIFDTLPPCKMSPASNATATQTPNRVAQNSIPASAEPRSEVVRAGYSESPISTNMASKVHSRAPLELRSTSKDKAGSLAKPKSSWGATLSVCLSLAVVLSFFLLVAWLFKKSQPNSFLKLPGDVVQVMGRTPMAPRQQMYVVRFGSKLLLISHQPGQTQTLGEITDADEVQRLAGLCEANHPGSISNSFRDVLKQVTLGKSDPEPRASTRLSRGRA